MPRNITVTFGDGSKHVYQNAPDDVTPESVSARASQEFGKAVAALDGGRGATPQQKGILGTIREGFDSILEPALTLATGAIAQPIGNIIGAGKELLTGDFGKGTAEKTAHAVSGAMTYQPRSQGGQENLQSLARAFDASKLAGLPMSGQELPQIARAAAQQIPLMQTIPAAVAGSPEVGALKSVGAALKPKGTTLNQEAFDTLARAREAGYVVPPSSVNPTFSNRLAESIPGKIATAQEASNINQAVTETLARRAIGLPEGTPLTTAATKQVRADAYQKGYSPIASLGRMATDGEFSNALGAIADKYTGAANSFPAAVRNDVGQMIDTLRVKEFGPGDAIKMSQILRDEASKSFTSGDKGLASAQRAASKAIEDQIERNLAAGGSSAKDVLKNFRDARELMAKSHSVEEAIREGSGTIDPKALARQLQGGAPLSGDLETIARFANTFEKANQRPGQVAGPGVHNLRTLSGAGVGGGVGAVLGGPLGAAAGGAASVVVPPAVRDYLLSQGVQNRLLGKVAPKNALAK